MASYVEVCLVQVIISSALAVRMIDMAEPTGPLVRDMLSLMDRLGHAGSRQMLSWRIRRYLLGTDARILQDHEVVIYGKLPSSRWRKRYRLRSRPNGGRCSRVVKT